MTFTGYRERNDTGYSRGCLLDSVLTFMSGVEVQRLWCAAAAMPIGRLEREKGSLWKHSQLRRKHTRVSRRGQFVSVLHLGIDDGGGRNASTWLLMRLNLTAVR